MVKKIITKVVIYSVIAGLLTLFTIRTVKSVKKQLEAGNQSFTFTKKTNIGSKTNSGSSGEKEDLIDSWLDIDPDDEDVTITWWVDHTTWDFYQIADLIYKRTGVKVNFQRALRDDGTELATYIAGTMPDIITITDYTTRVQLMEEGYVMPIDTLAEYYAPSLLPRISDEEYEVYSGSDGHLYGLANNFYDPVDAELFKECGTGFLPNHAIVVRLDMLNAYVDYMKSVDPTFNEDVSCTSPSGFIKMCEWVKKNYNLSNSNPTVTIGEFYKTAVNGMLSSGISALTDYFSVPKEDKDGNLLYEYAQPEYLEVLLFLNELFDKQLMISSNFAYSASNIITNIKNGLPFAVIGSIQNYSTGFAYYSAKGYDPDTKTFSPEYQYVPIVITNESGEVPLLSNMVGRGLRVTMVTKDAKRPDRIIKMIDYLMSEQGQRECYYGDEDCYNFVVEPGEEYTEVDNNGVSHTYTAKYGKIEWTDYAKEMLGSVQNTWYTYGIKQISLLQNPMYVMMTSIYDSEMDTYQFYTRYDMKCALIPYTAQDYSLFKVIHKGEDTKKLNEMVTLNSKLEEIWIEAVPQIIMAPSREIAISLYEKTLKKAKQMGYEKYLAFQNAAFIEGKDKKGIKYAWLKNNPDYEPVPLKLRGYYEENKKPLPGYLRVAE